MNQTEPKTPDAAPDRTALEDGLRCRHTLSMQSKLDLVGANTRRLALIEELVAGGVLDLYSFEERPLVISEREAKHYSPQTRGCPVHEHRPAVCRSYDCREDSRIWKDFAKRIPADPPGAAESTGPMET